MLNDPYPDRALLTKSQVRKLLGFSRMAEFNAFLKDTPSFPKAVDNVAKTAKGQPRELWKKDKVYAFIDLLGG